MHKPSYFIAVVSRDHVLKGVEGGFAQAGHGKSAPLKKMEKDDWLIYYSSKISMNGDEICQCFTAIGEIKDDNVYRVEMPKDFSPNRRNVNYRKCHDVSILPLIEKLSFIKDKKHWGYQFRFGIVEIPKEDFDLISNLMLN